MAAQALAEGLTAEKIDRLLRKWLVRLPHPYSAKDRAQITGQQWEDCSPLRSSFDQLLGHIDQFVSDAKLAA